ncbi:hypothetical protein JAAARDRAFT_74913 [Jaapia argillacea MUCL 33604]|uniref:Uncharacterized protein n=1 Tax=Jaapia argillacea MUCL 33604 TaxID=933084 RepID=A0A067QKS1_9AGAM|nr:hypothetical protein JAAARDRAFT_74913 [Jaapia argillacea MUCL 33604]
MSKAADIFSYVAGAISLAALFISLIWRSLPSTRMQRLEEVLEDTTKTLRSAVEDGALPDHKIVSKFEYRFTQLRAASRGLRLKTLSTSYPLKDWLDLCGGLPRSIADCTGEVEELRIEIIANLSQETPCAGESPARPASCPPAIRTPVQFPKLAPSPSNEVLFCDKTLYRAPVHHEPVAETILHQHEAKKRGWRPQKFLRHLFKPLGSRRKKRDLEEDAYYKRHPKKKVAGNGLPRRLGEEDACFVFRTTNGKSRIFTTNDEEEIEQNGIVVHPLIR